MRTNLKTKDATKQIIIDYLEENASDVLVKKIQRCGKTIDDCWNFITDSARKRAKNNCACIDDAEVFGWAIHYFEEEGNVKVTKTEPVKVVKTKENLQKTKVEKPKAEKPKKESNDMLPGQVTIFDFWEK